jgi:hypothetical protein
MEPPGKLENRRSDADSHENKNIDSGPQKQKQYVDCRIRAPFNTPEKGFCARKDCPGPVHGWKNMFARQCASP